MLIYSPITKAYISQKDMNLRQLRWLELLKDYEMSVLYNPGKDNVVADALSRVSMCSMAYVVNHKKELVKDIHRFVKLGVRIDESSKGSFMVRHNS